MGPVSAQSHRAGRQCSEGEQPASALPARTTAPQSCFSKHTGGASKMPGKGIHANKCLKPNNKTEREVGLQRPLPLRFLLAYLEN